jgi:hypothetical protein
VPIVVAPSLKVTVPVGVMMTVATVAVNVTDAPMVLGFADDDRVVVDGSSSANAGAGAAMAATMPSRTKVQTFRPAVRLRTGTSVEDIRENISPKFPNRDI